MIAQQVIIFYFIYWTLEEYANNAYFQSYVNSGLQGSGFTIIAISSVGIFTAVAAGMYMKLRQTHMELQRLAADHATPSTEDHAAGSVLAPHEEQHLINMIRKLDQTDAVSASMPTLKREEPSGTAK